MIAADKTYPGFNRVPVVDGATHLLAAVHPRLTDRLISLTCPRFHGPHDKLWSETKWGHRLPDTSAAMFLAADRTERAKQMGDDSEADESL